MNRIDVEKLNIQKNRIFTKGRHIVALLIVMGFLCIFGSRTTAKADFKYTPVEAHISFDCKEIDGIDGNVYKISIKSQTDYAPTPEQDTVTINDSGKGEFIVNIEEPGTYVYRLYQEKGSEDNIVYDDTEYDVHVCVMSDDNGNLAYSVAVTLADSAEKPESVLFMNSRITPETTEETTEQTTEGTTETTTEATTEKTTEGTTEKTTEKVTEKTTEGTTEAPPAKIETPEDNKTKLMTGDEARLALFLVLTLAAFVGIVVVIYVKKKNDPTR